MKINKTIISALVLILTCFAYSGCNKDEPVPEKPGNEQKPDVQKPDNSKDDLESLVPSTTIGYVRTGLFLPDLVDYTITLTDEYPNGTLLRFIDCPIFEYKLYNLENDKLVDSGETTTFCMEDIINHFARELVFNNKGEMTITSCLNPSPSFELPVVKYKYSYKNKKISISPSKNQKIQHLIFNPVIISKRQYSDRGYNYQAYDKRYPTSYIIVEENPYVIDFVNRLIEYLDEYGIPESSFCTRSAQKEFCIIEPDVEPCRSFWFDVALPFFYSMQGHSNQEEFNKEITTKTLDRLKDRLESYPKTGQFMYAPGYRFVKE